MQLNILHTKEDHLRMRSDQDVRLNTAESTGARPALIGSQ